jgi:hypothetical protein
MDWIDEFRGAMKVVPSRSQAIRYLVERGVAAETAVGRELIGKLAREAGETPSSRSHPKPPIGEIALQEPPERL